MRMVNAPSEPDRRGSDLDRQDPKQVSSLLQRPSDGWRARAERAARVKLAKYSQAGG